MAKTVSPIKLEPRKIADLVPYARNSRTHSDEQIDQIAASISEFGWTNPILVDEQGGVIAGHGRLSAAKRLGMAEVPTITLEGLTEAQRRALVIADNKLAENAGWDMEALAGEIEALGAGGFDLSLLGFDESALADLLADKTEGLTDPDDVPEAPAEPVSVLGDVWLLGKHRIVCGDSTSTDAIDVLMAGERADLLFTSPPYAQQRDYGAAKEQVGDWDALMRGVFSIVPVKAGGQVLVNLGLVHRKNEWTPYWNGWLDFMVEAGWRRFGWYVWDQGSGLPGDWNGRLAPSHEFIWHFNGQSRQPNKWLDKKAVSIRVNDSKGLRGKDGVVPKRSSPNASMQPKKIPDSVIRVNRNSSHKTGHPATFPVELARFIHLSFSKDGDVIFEPFCGAGSSIIAAEMESRHCFGMEIDPAYVDVAVLRWQEFTGQDATHAETGRTFAQESAERAKELVDG